MTLLLAFVLISCNAFKVISSDAPDKPVGDKPVVVEDSDKPTTEDNPKSKETEETQEYISVEFFGEQFLVEPHKTEFKVALILPFHYEAETKREQRTSSAMVEYYQGVKMALRDLEVEGLRMKLYVYDNENSDERLKRILDKSVMRHMDVIVGPLSKDHIKMVSDFALKHDIAVISPLTSIDEIETENQRLYSTTPSMQAKAETVANFMANHFEGNKVVIYNDGRSYANRLEPLLVEELKAQKVKVQAVNKDVQWANEVSDENTVIYVASHNPTTVNTTLSSIYQTKKPVTIFGENSWSNFEDNDYKFWNKMNIHLVASDFVDDTTIAVTHFRENFRLVNRRDPSLYAYLGYDQFKFMGDFLMAFGEHFPAYISGREFRYLTSNFSYEFEHGLNQNTNVFILKFNEFELQLAE
ncbi:MAG: amino acid ABC transporter substrate-binding protein [Bacteroidia bacterium]|nr:amino acid ABC transporter substrate-binding protein [Bacteroidia bacterium]